MALDFDQYAAKGNEIVNRLSEDMKVPKDKAGRILQDVLYAMRNRITIDDSLQVIARLPMALKSVYVDHWDPWHSIRRIRDMDEFIKEMRKYDKTNAGHDLETDESAKAALEGVFRTLHFYLSEVEFIEVISVLPRQLKDFINHLRDKT